MQELRLQPPPQHPERVPLQTYEPTRTGPRGSHETDSLFPIDGPGRILLPIAFAAVALTSLYSLSVGLIVLAVVGVTLLIVDRINR